MDIVVLTGEAVSGLASFSPILIMVVFFVIMYFLMIRPQKKKDAEDKKMRNNLEIGDEIVTIGGIVGRVTLVKDDTLVIETASDRTKIRLKRWCVQSVEKIDMGEA